MMATPSSIRLATVKSGEAFAPPADSCLAEHVAALADAMQQQAAVTALASSSRQQQQQLQHPQQQQDEQQEQQDESAQQPFWQGAWSFGVHADQVIPQYNEDRHLAVDLSAHPAFAGTCDRAGLFAVFDGHAGCQVADYLQDNFLQHVLAAGPAALAADPQAVLTAAVQQCEQEVLAGWHPGDPRAAGSTLCAVLLLDDKLHIANVGDSRATLVRGTTALPLTEDHSLQSPREKRRVSDADPDALCAHDDEYLYGSIKLSRGIGCAHLKHDASKQAYIATPDVSTRQLEPADDFVVIASDGFWDVHKTPNYVHPARRAFSRGGTAASVAQLLVQRAKGFDTLDNVTVVVLLLHGRGISVPRSNSRLQLM